MQARGVAKIYEWKLRFFFAIAYLGSRFKIQRRITIWKSQHLLIPPTRQPRNIPFYRIWYWHLQKMMGVL